MLQDLAHGRLENEYRPAEPRDDDFVLCFRGREVLLRPEGGALALPAVRDLPGSALRYLFRLHGRGYFLRSAPVPESEDQSWLPVFGLRQSLPKELCYVIMTSWHLYNWYKSNRFCGGCGAETVHDDRERMLRCPVCGNMIFPKISPAVIVAVTDGDRLLMTRYAGRGYTSYALIAGYTEIGETVEQTAAREVFEEVGVRIKNLRYYKSQPWGIDGNILMGFFCDLDGDDTIRLDENELSFAGWYPRSDLPAQDDGYSLTREMIRIFGEGNEPK